MREPGKKLQVANSEDYLLRTGPCSVRRNRLNLGASPLAGPAIQTGGSTGAESDSRETLKSYPNSTARRKWKIYCECDSDTGGSLDRPEGAGAWRRPPVAFDRRSAVLWGHGDDLEYLGLGAPGPPNSGGGDCAAAPERTRHRTLCSRSAFARQGRRTRGGESNALRRDGGSARDCTALRRRGVGARRLLCS